MQEFEKFGSYQKKSYLVHKFALKFWYNLFRSLDSAKYLDTNHKMITTSEDDDGYYDNDDYAFMMMILMILW